MPEYLAWILSFLPLEALLPRRVCLRSQDRRGKGHPGEMRFIFLFLPFRDAAGHEQDGHRKDGDHIPEVGEFLPCLLSSVGSPGSPPGFRRIGASGRRLLPLPCLRQEGLSRGILGRVP